MYTNPDLYLNGLTDNDFQKVSKTVNLSKRHVLYRTMKNQKHVDKPI